MPQWGLRLNDELARRIDVLAKAMRKHPNYAGLDLSRTDVIKLLVVRALPEIEDEVIGQQYDPEEWAKLAGGFVILNPPKD
jgi:hypothetical protein